MVDANSCARRKDNARTSGLESCFTPVACAREKPRTNGPNLRPLKNITAHRSSPVLDTLTIQNRSLIGYYMSIPRLSSPRKRQFAEQHCTQRKDSSQPPSKRQKVDHPACEVGFQRPTAFWDNLSKISLTTRSSRELDRENSQSAPSQEKLFRRKLHRPLTRISPYRVAHRGRAT